MWMSIGRADALTPPRAEAVISADGVYRLIVHPEQPWQAAEIAIAGSHSEDVGQTPSGQTITLTGRLSAPGVIWLNITAALDAHRGVNWVFSVEPEIVPVAPPEMRRIRRRSLKRRLFQRRAQKQDAPTP